VRRRSPEQLREAHGPELHTVEVSHGKPRLTQPRPSDLGTVETGIDRRRDHDEQGRFRHGNRAAVGRSARSALRAPLRAARERIRLAVPADEPNVADELLDDALRVVSAARLELGSRSVFTEGPLISYATESILAGFYMREAAREGFLTAAGARLHERAQACQQQALRAMTGCLAAAKALAARDGRADPHAHQRELVEAFGESATSEHGTAARNGRKERDA
jgi:hypothetical protein